MCGRRDEVDAIGFAVAAFSEFVALRKCLHGATLKNVEGFGGGEERMFL